MSLAESGEGTADPVLFFLFLLLRCLADIRCSQSRAFYHKSTFVQEKKGNYEFTSKKKRLQVIARSRTANGKPPPRIIVKEKKGPKVCITR